MEKQKNIPKLRFPEFAGEWRNKKLGEVAVFLDGRRKPIKESVRAMMKGIYPYYGASGIIDYVNEYIFDEEIILLGEDGENIISRNSPLAFRVSGKCWINNHAHVIKPNIDSDIDFLTYSLERVTYLQYNTGTAQPKLNQEVCKGIVLHFPSHPEQTKIATFLTSIDNRVTQLKQKKTLLEQYKKGVMQKIFDQEIRFKDDDGNEFPDWDIKCLDDIGEIVTGKTPSTADINLWNGDIQFVTPTDIDTNKYQYKTGRTIQSNSKVKVLPSKTIMFTCIASIGKMSLSVYPCITNQQINSIIPKKGFLNEFIYYAILNIVDYIKSTQSSSTLPIINKTEFSKFEINIPSSIFEQTKIANFLSAIDEKIIQCSNQIDKTEQYKKGVLQQMFV